jgi:hypothetical protein
VRRIQIKVNNRGATGLHSIVHSGGVGCREGRRRTLATTTEADRKSQKAKRGGTWESKERNRVFERGESCRGQSISPTHPLAILMATTLTTPLTPPPISPGVGARRRGPKSLPTLPPSAFSPPDSGISDSFPLPQSPTTVHPERIVDARVRCSIPEWKEQVNGSSIGGGRVGAIVVKTSESDLEGFVTFFFLF